MALDMVGKVALVTGAGSGLGRASALLFAEKGAKVVVVDISAEDGQATVDLIKKAGGEAIFIKTDVTKSVDVKAMVEKTVEKYGRLDYAHNNAGISGPKALVEDFSEEAFDKVMEINVKGIFLCMKYEFPVMVKQGGGAIANTSSGAGLVGTERAIAYVASKHAIVGLSKAAALDYCKKGVRVNAVCSGIMNTPMTEKGIQDAIDASGLPREKIEAGLIAGMIPLGRLGQPKEVAEAAVWLCSDAASFVTGAALSADGGFAAR